MSNYVVSARKYRPDSFETLIGQETISRTLRNSIERGTIAHAYLFCGPRGVGKTSTARIFAKAINCAHPDANMEPCGECESCVSFREGRSYCIHELDAASNNGVEDIKALLDQVQIPPQVGRYSVYIIDEVHMLSQSAFNAFLKTLEEPPSHAIFILATTEKHKILPTILSRCQTYDFNRISITDIMKNLRDIAGKEGVTIEDDALHVIAKKADGAMRDALTIFDQSVAFCGSTITREDLIRNLGELDYEYCFSLVEAFLAKDHAKALTIFDEILSKGFNALHFVASLSSHLRDLIVSRTAGAESLLDMPQNLRKRYSEQAGACSLQYLYDALSITTQCESGYKASVNQRLHIEFALMKLCFLQGVPQSPAAIATSAAPEPVTTETKAPAKTETPEETVTAEEEPAKAATQEAVAKTTAGMLSLASLMSKPAEKKEENDSKEEISEQKEAPSDERMTECWQMLIKDNASRPRLANALSTAKLTITENEGIKTLVFEVTNEAQKGWIETNLLRSLEAAFRMYLGNNSARLEVRASAFEEKKVIYMPEEKAKSLMENNEEVRNLVVDLGLDIK